MTTQQHKKNPAEAKHSSASTPFFQPKLTINHPNDAYEQEAEAMADRVMRMPDSSVNNNTFFKPSISSIQRKCALCDEEAKKVQRKEENNSTLGKASAAENYITGLQGKGRPLTPGERRFFEPRFGYDFSGVQLHTNNEASQSAKGIQALAYTHENNIVFGDNQYQPETENGKKLLAHELTHVVQQSKNISTEKIQRVTDSEVEGGTGVEAGIAAGTMTQDPIMGQNFDISCGFRNYTARFRFAKAYKGTYPYSAAGKEVKGVYVKIEMSITDNRYCGRCTPMLALQTLRNTVKNSSGSLETSARGSNTRKERSGWDNADAPSRGWRVDALTSETNPFYTSSWMGQEGSEMAPAIIWDTPGNWSTDSSMGKDFNTSIVCQTASGSKWTVGYVHWGYYIDSSGNIVFEPSTPEAFCGSSQETRDASERWDSLSGNTATGITF